MDLRSLLSKKDCFSPIRQSSAKTMQKFKKSFPKLFKASSKLIPQKMLAETHNIINQLDPSIGSLFLNPQSPLNNRSLNKINRKKQDSFVSNENCSASNKSYSFRYMKPASIKIKGLFPNHDLQKQLSISGRPLTPAKSISKHTPRPAMRASSRAECGLVTEDIFEAPTMTIKVVRKPNKNNHVA